MTKEDLILEKLERLEAQIEPLVNTSKAINELKEDLIPIGNYATALMINELQEVEAGFQLDDLMSLMKEAMRNTENFIFALKHMASLIEFVKDLEPLLKSFVPEAINYLNDLEQQGVFRILKSTLDMRAKIAQAYTPEDFEKVSDGLVAMLGLAETMSDPATLQFLQKFAEIPSKVDLTNVKKTGPLGLMFAGFNGEIGEGLGVLMELTKAMGKMKDNENGADS